MSGEGEIINGFQTDRLRRIRDFMKLIIFSGDYLSEQCVCNLERKKESVKLLEKKHLDYIEIYVRTVL